MPPHAKEKPAFRYTLATQKAALRSTKDVRRLPDKIDGKLLAGTWNLTNFGHQDRSDDDLRLMAEVISWFDVIAIQEIADDLSKLRKLMTYLPGSFRVVLSDIGGNSERAGFFYDANRVQRLELAAEVAVPPKDHRYIRMKGVSGEYRGFDRNPYVVAFRAGGLEFSAVSAHLYYGGTTYVDLDRRTLEAYALARWADLRHKAAGAYSNNVLVMGDMNLPKRDPSDNVYRALTKRGLILPPHSTSVGGAVVSDAAYDQVGFQSSHMKQAFTGSVGVFDFDRAPFFRAAWDRSEDYFFQSVKRHIADHRPLWIQFDT